MHTIPSVLPHRYPFLMVDRVTEVEPGVSAAGWKNVTWNEWFITEEQPYMPGTMILEALAQLGAFAMSGSSGGLGFLSAFGGVEFLGQARPGDRIELQYEIVRNRRGFVLGKGTAAVDGSVIVKADELMVYYQSESPGSP
ncbi:3-hydroxyacyl-ACP dehydratase FabZ family protein [Paenibacillus silviterrae]|uniref:3-hydroxyacyl-ACP dehydratase FabZ family protein n=1 Tax=Paenibacillus silviterrae TaxID=3242194 RepID=UPI00254385A1|nr:3-hydroxyacyl-ACP dehydratase FabZ family protein [Paenibacillus chinjuensis]